MYRQLRNQAAEVLQLVQVVIRQEVIRVRIVVLLHDLLHDLLIDHQVIQAQGAHPELQVLPVLHQAVEGLEVQVVEVEEDNLKKIIL